MARFLKPTVKSIEEFSKIKGVDSTTPTKNVEVAGRTCYNSFDKIDDHSDQRFVMNMIKSGHEAMIEFAHIIIKVDIDTFEEIRYSNFKFLNMTEENDNYLVSGNMRAWRNFIKTATCSNILKEYLLYIFKQTQNYSCFFYDIDYNREVSIADCPHQINIFNSVWLSDEEKLKHLYFHFVIEADRGVMAEITRHRPASFACQSTRYVNFKKGAEFVYPHWYNKKVKGCLNNVKHFIGKLLWRRSCSLSEDAYKWMIRLGYKPQDARAVLPNSLKTIINISGNLEMFEWIFHLRSAKSAHPDIRIISDKMKRYIDMYK